MQDVKCSICGKKGLRFFDVCPDCLKRSTISPVQIQRLKHINNVLCITSDTDGNIKKCVQSLTEILEDLERNSYGKEEKKIY